MENYKKREKANSIDNNIDTEIQNRVLSALIMLINEGDLYETPKKAE